MATQNAVATSVDESEPSPLNGVVKLARFQFTAEQKHDRHFYGIQVVAYRANGQVVVVVADVAVEVVVVMADVAVVAVLVVVVLADVAVVVAFGQTSAQSRTDGGESFGIIGGADEEIQSGDSRQGLLTKRSSF